MFAKHLPGGLACLIAFSLAATLHSAETLKIYYGLLHSHTSFSDGSGTPAEAFQKADERGVDFFAITEHNHDDAESGAGTRRDGVLISKTPALYNSPTLVTYKRGTKTLKAKSVRQAALDASTPQFTAIHGQEFSSISSGNHVNVLGIDNVITVPNGNYAALFTSLATASSSWPVVIQMNHPDVQADLFSNTQDDDERKKMFNDYGYDDFGKDFAALVRGAGDYVRLIEIFSGPSATIDKKFTAHRYSHHGNDYYYYLAQGFRLSPSVGHDDHHKHWGHKSPARMGIFAESVSPQHLFEAMRLNRTFATEDTDMKVRFEANDKFMGSTVALAPDTAISFKVFVKDGESDDGGCEVKLISGIVEPQKQSTLRRLFENDHIRDTKTTGADGSVTFDGFVATVNPEFYYVIVKQEDGDRAWSAPIWITRPAPAVAATQPATTAAMFAWTTNNSKFYHKTDCVAVGSIRPENLATGATPPAGRELHACKPKTVPDDGH